MKHLYTSQANSIMRYTYIHTYKQVIKLAALK